MIYVFGIILISLISLWIWMGITKPDLPTTDISYSKPFLGAAVQLYAWYRKIIRSKVYGGENQKRRIQNRKLIANLQILHPGEPSDLQIYRFTVEKISMVLLVIMIGSILGLLIAMDGKSGILNENSQINRNDYGGMDVEADLIAGIEMDDGEYEAEMNVIVAARKYSKEEANELFDRLSEEIDEIILAQNDSADHVIYPMNLVRNIEGYPFSINWECSNYEYLDTDGSIHNENLSQGVLINLRGDCVYEHDHWYINRTYRICPQELSAEELISKELADKIIEADNRSASQYVFTLPNSISEGAVSWREKIKDDSPVILGLIVLICVAIPGIREAEVTADIKKRSRQLLIDYPAFISKLTLYMGAGMSVKNCFLRMGHEYTHCRTKRNSYLGQEISITAHELELGISELEAYEQFGKRCGNREYMRFVTLLCQNLRKGSTDLLRLLAEESEDAFVIRKNEARKLGEEASTKLLLPMVMMLAIVMVVIMVPAYMSFST